MDKYINITAQKLLKYLLTQNKKIIYVSDADLADKLCRTERTVYITLADLESKGYIKRFKIKKKRYIKIYPLNIVC